MLEIDIRCVGQTIGGDLLFETGWRKDCMSESIIKLSLDELKRSGVIDAKEDFYDIEGKWFVMQIKKGE